MAKSIERLQVIVADHDDTPLTAYCIGCSYLLKEVNGGEDPIEIWRTLLVDSISLDQSCTSVYDQLLQAAKDAESIVD